MSTLVKLALLLLGLGALQFLAIHLAELMKKPSGQIRRTLR